MPQRKKIMECSYCGELLTGEDVDAPFDDGQGCAICEECHTEHFEFTCCRCEEYEHVDYQDALGCLLVVDASDDVFNQIGVPTGIYRIIKHPYYQVELLGANHAYAESLELVTPHLNEADPSPYPAGHLCFACAEKIGRLHPPRVRIVIDPRRGEEELTAEDAEGAEKREEKQKGKVLIRWQQNTWSKLPKKGESEKMKAEG